MSGILTVLAGMGTGSAQIILNDRTVFANAPLGTAEARYELRNDGFVYDYTNSAGYTQIEEWVLPTDAADDYEIKATWVSGATPTGSGFGSWLALTSTRNWILTSTTFASSVFDVEIRDAASQTVRDSARITLFASAQ